MYPATPAVPRLAATVLLVRDDPFEVLMVRRHENAVFGSALVFPGGTVDEADHADVWLDLIEEPENLPAVDRAVRIAGLRETFEETSLLIARRSDGSRVHQPEPESMPSASPFHEVVRSSGGKLALGDIHPYSHWITPERLPKRWDTWFLLAEAPPGQTPRPDGAELVDFEWVAPADLVERAKAGEQSILFPTLMNLSRLAESADTASAIEAARNRAAYTVLPWVEERADGSRFVVLPDDAGYGVTEFPAP